MNNRFHIFSAILTVLLSNTLSGAQAHQSEHRLVLDERDLLKRYLEVVEKNNQTHLQIELAKLQFSQSIQEERAQRERLEYWTKLAEVEREKEINQYWSSYRAGQFFIQKAAQNTTLTLASCDYLKSELSAVMTSQKFTQVKEAFERGAKSEKPECFWDNVAHEKIRSLDKRIGDLERVLFDLENFVVANEPSDRQSYELNQGIKQALANRIDVVVSAYVSDLQSIASFSEAEWAEIQKNVQLIASRISCTSLKNRNGLQQSCLVSLQNSELPLNKSAAYKILLGQQKIGVYQPRLYLGSLLTAVRAYEENMGSSDEWIEYSFRQISKLLERADQTRSERLNNLKKAYAINVKQALQYFQFDLYDLVQNKYPLKSKDTLVEVLYQMKTELQAYLRWETQLKKEEQLLRPLVTRFNSVVQNSAKIKMNIRLDDSITQVLLNDSVKTVFELPYVVQQIPAAYLLGRNAQEANRLAQSLKVYE